MGLLTKKKTVHLVLIVLITILVYANSFKNDFVYDDTTHILKNIEIRYISNIPRFFISPFKDIYRPLRSIDYMAVYFLSGENSFGYHLHNLLLHLLVIVLVYLIVDLLIGKKSIAFIAALLFGIHPIHTERVTNITAGFDLLGILFIFLSLYLYILYSKNGKRKFYMGSIFSFVLALFSSEEAIILPFILLLYETCFNNLKKRLKRYGIFFVIVFIFVLFRAFILKIGARASEYIAGNLYYTILTMSKVIVKYIWLLFVPVKLTLYHEIETARSLFDIKVIFSMFFLLALIYFAFRFYKAKKEISFIVGWFFITLIPFLNLVPITTLIAERYLYIPSFAFCLLMAMLIHKISRLKEKYHLKENTKAMAILLVVILVVSYAILTTKRNIDWRDDLTLWTKTIALSPSSSEAHDNLGFAYERIGKVDKAIVEFKKAIELNPFNYKAYTNLGTSYAQKKEFALAEEYLKRAIRINPWYKAHNYLGIVYGQQERFNESISEFKKAIIAEPNFDEAYYNLGLVYEYIGEYELAKQEFERAFKLNPKDEIYIKKIKARENFASQNYSLV